ncbi:MAG: hypothetical protein ISP79_00465 [Methylophilaceae bacterium]|jgi:hypothetical protein|nr:hypothetical protein [Methylophilaceae bacterium]MBL6728068.1 hypothetical protein [Methylophilaceae bacterium]MBL6790474.1 hypothetical protein [Methylophilaceae bacterium]
MSELDEFLNYLEISYEKLNAFVILNLSEFVLGILIISIAVVIISMAYVLVLSKATSKKRSAPKRKKMKYTNEFIQGVQGIDLDLKK